MGTIHFRADITQTIDIKIPIDGLQEMKDKDFQNLSNQEILELLDAIHPANVWCEHLTPSNPDAVIDNFDIDRIECYDISNWSEIAAKYEKQYELCQRIRTQGFEIEKLKKEITALSNDGADEVQI
tara:strand:+ start:194 stop:571 length:378 start_codon:yes stop_codon:yes gene_type:complete